MSDILTRQLGKSSVAAFTKELNDLLDKINENGRLTREADKEIKRLRKQNDKSFEKMKKAVELATQ
ncbi:MAG: hypothetical protein IT174_12860 [Acidobacteria bacterium]|nr:hypothetical protein [Acidobacteriota bacterium]